MKSFFYKTRWLFLITAIILILDQVSKIFVRANLAIGETWVPWPWLAPYARIIHWTNTGVAFGMFQGNNILFAVVAFIVACVIVYYYPQVPAEDKILRFALAMQLGGALGNFVDRVFVGEVTDFLSVGNFAVFNVADSCITVGVVILAIGVWLQDRREKEEKAAQELENHSEPLDQN